MTKCNPVATPYVKLGATVTGAQVEAKDMSNIDATLYRRAAARINYVALDRPDHSFASRVALSCMSSLKGGDDQVIKRIIRYLKGTAQGGYQVPVPRRVGGYNGFHRFRSGWR